MALQILQRFARICRQTSRLHATACPRLTSRHLSSLTSCIASSHHSYVNHRAIRFRHSYPNQSDRSKRPKNRDNTIHAHKQKQYHRWDVRSSLTIPSLLQLSIDNFDVSYPSTIAAVWNRFPVLLKTIDTNNVTTNDYINESTIQANVVEREETGHRIAFLIHRTIQSVETFRPKEMATILLSLAKIHRLIRWRRNRTDDYVYHGAFWDIFFDTELLRPKEEMFAPLTDAAYRNLDRFDGRCLSNLVYAYALMGYNPHIGEDSTLLDGIAEVCLGRIKEFEPQGISNTLWSFATLGVVDSRLFQSMGDFMVQSSNFKEFKPQELSNILWAFASSGESHSILFERIGESILQSNHLNRFKPQELSSTLWSYAAMGTKQADLFDTIGEHIASLDDLKSFHPQALSNTVYAYAKAGHHHSALFQSIADSIIEREGLQHFHSQALANILWSYATLDETHPDLFHKIGDSICEIPNKLDYFNSQEIANMVWAYATAGIPHPDLFQKVGDVISLKNNLHSYKVQELSNVLWAFATLDGQHLDMFDQIGDYIVSLQDLNAFNSQELSTLVWSYATAKVCHPKLFKRVADAIVERADIDSFKPQEVSKLVWAFAKADELNPGLLTFIGDLIIQHDNLSTFKPQELINIAWAYAHMAEQYPSVLNRIGNEIDVRDLSTFTPQNLSNAIWAYATAHDHIPRPELFEKIATAILTLDSLDSFTSQTMSNTLWAFARAKVSSPALFDEIGQAVVELENLDSFTSQELSNLLWAYATSNEVRYGTFKKIADAIISRKDLRSFSSQSLSNIAWACAVADYDEPALFNEEFVDTIVEKHEEFTPEALRQLHQWHIWQTKENDAFGLPQEMEKRCYQVFIDSICTVSTLQKNVTNELSAIGLNPQVEHLTDSGYSLDALVDIDGQKIGIEVDGPLHFIKSKANGSTMLKRRQVAAVDLIAMVSVPYWEWNQLENADKKQQYLRSLLENDS